jgi:RimJ/RimL family protein N-acetyltransferase
MLRREFWSHGYTTEAVQSWLKEYWSLPCRKVEMQDMMREHVQPHWQGNAVGEALFAYIESRHAGSIRATQKCGFKPTGFEGEIEDSRGMAVLVRHYLERPEA